MLFLSAEREGFKPPVPVTVHLISNQAHSITLTSLRIITGRKYNTANVNANVLLKMLFPNPI